MIDDSKDVDDDQFMKLLKSRLATYDPNTPTPKSGNASSSTSSEDDEDGLLKSFINRDKKKYKSVYRAIGKKQDTPSSQASVLKTPKVDFNNSTFGAGVSWLHSVLQQQQHSIQTYDNQTHASSTFQPYNLDSKGKDILSKLLQSKKSLSFHSSVSIENNNHNSILYNVMDDESNHLINSGDQNNDENYTNSSHLFSTLLRIIVSHQKTYQSQQKQQQQNSSTLSNPKENITSPLTTTTTKQQQSQLLKHPHISIVAIIKACTPYFKSRNNLNPRSSSSSLNPMNAKCFIRAADIPSSFDSNRIIYAALNYLSTALFDDDIVNCKNKNSSPSSLSFEIFSYFPIMPLVEQIQGDKKSGNGFKIYSNHPQLQSSSIQGSTTSSNNNNNNNTSIDDMISKMEELLQDPKFLFKLENLESCFWSSTVSYPSRLRIMSRLDSWKDEEKILFQGVSQSLGGSSCGGDVKQPQSQTKRKAKAGAKSGDNKVSTSSGTIKKGGSSSKKRKLLEKSPSMEVDDSITYTEDNVDNLSMNDQSMNDLSMNETNTQTDNVDNEDEDVDFDSGDDDVDAL